MFQYILLGRVYVVANQPDVLGVSWMILIEMMYMIPCLDDGFDYIRRPRLFTIPLLTRRPFCILVQFPGIVLTDPPLSAEQNC